MPRVKIEEVDDDEFFDEDDLYYDEYNEYDEYSYMTCESCGAEVGYEGVYNEDGDGPFCVDCYSEQDFERYMESFQTDYEDD